MGLPTPLTQKSHRLTQAINSFHHISSTEQTCRLCNPIQVRLLMLDLSPSMQDLILPRKGLVNTTTGLDFGFQGPSTARWPWFVSPMSRANKQTSVGEEGGNLPGTRNICGASQAPRILGHGIGCPWGIRTTTPPKTARREQQSVKAGLVWFSMSWEFGCDYVVWPHPKPEQPGILKKSR